MQTMIHGRQVEIAPALREMIDKKLDKLTHHLEFITDAEVVVTHGVTKTARELWIVQCTLVANGTPIRAEERGATAQEALDLAVDKLDRQIKRFKDKLYRKGRLSGSPKIGEALGAEALAELEAAEPEGGNGTASHVVRVKNFQAKPMSADEAIEQMELLGHGFFVFQNAETNQVNVLYRREDGTYGVLVPEM